MKPLHHPIGLWVVSGGVPGGSAHEPVEMGPELGRELRPAVRGEVGRDTEARDPAPEQGLGAVLGRGRGTVNK
jgi:hypothetical protein